ncbi:MAG TPA: CidA/LrgA family protein [Azonexus sp.]|nr:CidA/LrgA family protein [Azonexus sp.]
MMVQTFATLVVFQAVGEGIAYGLALPVPGPVIGMVLLFLYLIVKKDAMAKLAPGSNHLLRHLSLLFIPAGAGIMPYAARLADEWLAISVALVASTVVSIIITASVLRWLHR